MAQESISLSTGELGVFPTEHASEIHGISDIQFRVHLIDDNFPGGAISQTALCDFTGDGELEYHVGGCIYTFFGKCVSLIFMTFQIKIKSAFKFYKTYLSIFDSY